MNLVVHLYLLLQMRDDIYLTAVLLGLVIDKDQNMRILIKQLLTQILKALGFQRVYEQF